jgi:hypothetical protein
MWCSFVCTCNYIGISKMAVASTKLRSFSLRNYPLVFPLELLVIPETG